MLNNNIDNIDNIVRAEVCQAIHSESVITMADIKDATEKWEQFSKIRKIIACETTKCNEPDLEPFYRIK